MTSIFTKSSLFLLLTILTACRSGRALQETTSSISSMNHTTIAHQHGTIDIIRPVYGLVESEINTPSSLMAQNNSSVPAGSGQRVPFNHDGSRHHHASVPAGSVQRVAYDTTRIIYTYDSGRRDTINCFAQSQEVSSSIKVNAKSEWGFKQWFVWGLSLLLWFFLALLLRKLYVKK